MTLEELQNSDVVKQWLHTLLQNRTFADILDTIQRVALPSKENIQAPMVPGLHPDTAMAHKAHFHAGWVEAIQFLKDIPRGAAKQPFESDEQPWESLPDIRAIDEEIEQARKKLQTTTPQP